MVHLALVAALVASPHAGPPACHPGSRAPCRLPTPAAAARLAVLPAAVLLRPGDLISRLQAVAGVEPADAIGARRPPSISVVELEDLQSTDDERCLGWYRPVTLRHPPLGWRWLALDVAGVPALQSGHCNVVPRLELLGG